MQSEQQVLHSHPSPHHTSRRSLHRILRKVFIHHWRLWVFAAITGITLLVIFAGYTYIAYTNDVATPDRLMNRNNTGLVITDRNDVTLYKSEGVKNFDPISIDQVPKQVRDATVAIEDRTFYSHPGVSLLAIGRSLYMDVRAGGNSRYGGSTITQQLVKNALLSPEKSIKRKFQEAILALEVERRYSKDQILEMYLNSIYYGAGAYGIQEAAHTYFNKLPAKLTIAQAALLAALPQAPSALSPFGGDEEALKNRMILVLTAMTEQGYITPKQKEAALQEKITFAKPPKGEDFGNAPHFAVWIRQYLTDKYGEDTVTRLGMHVKTTLDNRLQEAAQTIVTKQVARLATQHVSNGAATTINPNTGEILAMVGSTDWNNDTFGKFNTVFSKRQPGSSFKPIVYTRAFIMGKKPEDILHDKPTDFDGYKPKNYDGKFRGDVTIRRALANSLNVPAVELLQTVGIPNALDQAKAMGITTMSDASHYGLSLVLGGGEVQLFELTRAYGTLATGGSFVPSYPILEIHDKFDKLLYAYHPDTKTQEDHFEREGLLSFLAAPSEPYANQLINSGSISSAEPATAAYMTTSILADSYARAEEFGTNSPLNLSRQAAAKTGTTDDYRDSWTVGYTPDLVTGVWIGNNDNTPMERIAGSIGAAPIWHDIMETAHRGKPVHTFERPTDVISVELCSDTGKPACSSCTKKYTEVFPAGSVPEKNCPEDYTPTPTPETPTPEATEERPADTDTPAPVATNTPIPTQVSQPTPTAVVVTISPPIPTIVPTL